MVPENAEKIRLTFDITVDNPSGKYALYGTLINEKNEKWEFQETQGLTQIIEFNNVTGNINLSLLMTLAHADLTIEWFEISSHLKVYLQNSEGHPITGAVVSSTSQPSGQSSLSGTTDSDGSVTFSDVKLGSYTFQASQSGYITKSGSVSAQAGETTEITITLEEEAPPAEEKEEEGGGGIPGFPYESIILGFVLGALFLWMLQRRQSPRNPFLFHSTNARLSE